MADFPIYRLVKGSQLTFSEMDGNLNWLSTNLSGSLVTISGSTKLFGDLTSSRDIRINGITIGKGNTNGSQDTAIGNNALSVATVSGASTAIGYYSLVLQSTGYRNTALGASSGGNVTIGIQNTLIGVRAGINITTGNNNIYLGYSSANNGLVDGSNNTIVGSQITGLSSTLNNNIVLADGEGNIKYRWDGTQNNIYGNLLVTSAVSASSFLITSSANVLEPIPKFRIGDSSGDYVSIWPGKTAGTTELFIRGNNPSYGSAWSYSITTGYNITHSAGGYVDNLCFNMGANNALTLKGSGNVIMGGATDTNLYKLDVIGKDARINGVRVGRGNNNQIENTVVGDLAFISNQTGTRNTAVGFEALYSNTTGRFNTAYGMDALYYNSVGQENVAIGYSALQSNRSGSWNTILGGSNTGYEITSGSWNTIIGTNSGRVITIGNNNTIIGGRLNNSSTPGAPFTTTMSDNVILGDGKGYIRYRFDGTQNNFYDNVVVTGSVTFTRNIGAYDFLVQNTNGSPYPDTSITISSTLDSNYGISRLNLNTGTKTHYISTWGAYGVLGLRFNTSGQATNTDVSTLFAQRYTDRPTQLILNFDRGVQVVGTITDEWIYIRAQADTNTSKAFRIVGTDYTTDRFTVYGDGSTRVSGSLTLTSVLTLPPVNPLPTNSPTGSFAVSGSGVDCKPYFWNGTSWTALF